MCTAKYIELVTVQQIIDNTCFVQKKKQTQPISSLLYTRHLSLFILTTVNHQQNILLVTKGFFPATFKPK
jgi:hypothetical protein